MKEWSCKLLSRSPKQTIKFGFRLGQMLQPGTVVLLEAPLGGGKTLLAKGIGQALGIGPNEIRSPTFAIIQEYREGRIPLCHADLYRLSAAEVRNLSLHEYWRLKKGGSCGWIVVIEWGEKIKALLPLDLEEILFIQLKQKSINGREILISGDVKWKKRLEKNLKKF